ncbi:helix-turn-helix transcriptional regulator [Lentzea sp. BCCO 10_0856]|uniref:Helix-turn-helix transcriptional regulator n=1 Tax=Lentzea miocenica TaxID=3095431 RepID=A0ABU4T5Q5_9PSEU|nr:helix-turn-helix transcriptional regulator [Lentzea sp. BCCO 10_0856]MDX8033491.1 helix-turn-helix transcriptional regulator [Lentzea sp. BCCO 10_0856]
MDRAPLTPRSRELGDELRTLRERFARGSEFAKSLDWDPSKVSNIERGKVHPTDIDLAQFLTACGKDRRWITEFIGHYRQAFEPYFAQQPTNSTTILFAERTATTITGYGGTMIPDLVRTDAYTEHTLQQCGATPEQIRSAVQSQQERCCILRASRRPAYMFYVNETAVRAQLDDDRTRMDQLELLKRMAWALRVVPAGKELPSSSGFTLYEYEKMPATAVVDCDVARVFAQDDAATSRCRRVLARLDHMALSHSESRDLFSQLLTEEYVAAIATASGERPDVS